MRKSRRIEKLKDFINKNKNRLITGAAVILLALVTIYISYAYYQVTDKRTITLSTVGDIPDLEVRVMAQKRDANGNALNNEYELYPYIPKAGYEYKSELSYCANGSTINYKTDEYSADITSAGTDVCYLYFNSTAQLDVTLNVYVQDIDENGKGKEGKYTLLNTSTLPSIGYELDKTQSECDKDATIEYDKESNMLLVNATKKNTTCTAYMNALDVDALIRLHLETKKGTGIYYNANSIPSNIYYTKDNKSTCTNNGEINYDQQEITLTSTTQTVCDLYLNIDSGPIASSILLNKEKNQVIANLEDSNLGTNVEKWYYSTDGENYESSEENTIVLPSSDNYYFYGTDASGKESKVIEMNGQDYIYNGLFDYSSSVQTKEITVPGYYKLEVWGAQGGSYNETFAKGGMGGYSEGIIYLNAGDILYIHTGGAGTYNSSLTTTSSGGVNGGGSAGYRGGTGGGATDIRINQDDLYARVIVAGGGGGAYAYNSTYKADGAYAGGLTAGRGNYTQDSVANWAGGAGSIASGGTGGVGPDALYNGESGTFGQGGSTGKKNNDKDAYSSGAGGGGFYGGGAGANFDGSDYTKAASGGGGTGYIYTEQTAKYYPEGCLLNPNYYLTQAKSIAGNKEFLNPYGQMEEGHMGSGYAKVTYLGSSL